MKLSKSAKTRIKLMTIKEKASLAKATKLLFENNCITDERAKAIIRTLESKSLWRS